MNALITSGFDYKGIQLSSSSFISIYKYINLSSDKN